MAQTIFYSWQSDIPSSTNRNFIEDAIKKAIADVKTKFDVQEAMRDDNFKFDKDTLDLPGTPPITDSIFDKISKCAIFIPDLTFVGKTAKDRLLPNSNVLIEYGYALKAVTTARIIPVMNEAFGEPSDNNMPFNMRHLRNPICYSLEEGSSAEEKAAIKKQLVLALSKAIETVVKSGALSKVAPGAPDDALFKKRILEFKGDRVSKLFHNDTPVPFNTNPKIVLHLIPSSSLSSTNHQLDLRPISSNPATIRPIGSSGMNSKFTFDGFVTYSNSRDTDKSYTYVHLYKSGIIEAVNGGIINPDYDGKKFRAILFENKLIEALDHYSGVLRKLNISAPIYMFLSILGVADYTLDVGNSFFREETHAIDRDQLLLPEMLIDSLDFSASDILRPCFDNIWNAFGYSHSYNYDDFGKRIN